MNALRVYGVHELRSLGPPTTSSAWMSLPGPGTAVPTGAGPSRTVVVPGGIGADLRMRGKIAGSPLEDGSGHVRVREALRVRALNEWVDVEQTVGELADRLDLLRGSKRQGRSNC